MSTGGVFIGGGIAPKILPALTTGTFMRAFRAKPPLDAMLAAMPVKVILNAEAGLLGAAVFAASGDELSRSFLFDHLTRTSASEQTTTATLDHRTMKRRAALLYPCG